MKWNLKKFNELTITELYNILKERTKVFIVEQDCPYLEVDGKDTQSYHLFLDKEGEIIAYLRILPSGVSYPEASLGRVLVKKEYRGLGLGKELLKRGIDFIQNELKETTIKIQAQNYLNKLYSSFGFQTVSNIYLEDNIPHIDMLLQIKHLEHD